MTKISPKNDRKLIDICARRPELFAGRFISSKGIRNAGLRIIAASPKIGLSRTLIVRDVSGRKFVATAMRL